MGRLLIVSNRLPWVVADAGSEATLVPASGGLASGLLPWHERSGGKWVGWPGHSGRLPRRTQAALSARGLVPVHLTPEQVTHFYEGFSNRVLWPLFHYLVDRVPVDASGWDAYREVNCLFADHVVREYRPGDTVWIQDYQLMLVPALVRQRLPAARIGFFLHIPFPAAEVFRTLPWRNELLTGLLGADLIGFHTYSYLGHFLAAVRDVDGIDVDLDHVRTDGRTVQLGAFPMGVDAAAFARECATDAVLAEVEAIRRAADGRAIVLGIDRLDYTKGIPRRLAAIERLLVRTPEFADRIRYIQVAVPSREQVDAYRRFRRDVEERVSRINGRCATFNATPIHYVHQAIAFSSLVALYRAADVMLVTPLRDGMNLIAKEFVAARSDGDGVLVLSEFAGAASELDGALIVNPYDVDATADAVGRALTMSEAERRVRMETLRRRVLDYDVHHWADRYLQALDRASRSNAPRDAGDLRRLARRLAAVRAAGPLHLVLDYDGTLVPFAPTPDLAIPDAALLELLQRLAAQPGIQISIVSGRPREQLTQWLGRVPVALWAEHGAWYRAGPRRQWTRAGACPPGLLDRIQPILEAFTAATPGSLVERKSTSVAWHYRNAADAMALRRARELKSLLTNLLRHQPLEVLEGHKVVEIRLRGISKGSVVDRLLRDRRRPSLVAIGDDHTDEDLFRALPDGSISIGVGDRPTGARFVVRDHRAVRRLLGTLVEAGPATVAADSPPRLRRALAISLSSN